MYKFVWGDSFFQAILPPAATLLQPCLHVSVDRPLHTPQPMHGQLMGTVLQLNGDLLERYSECADSEEVGARPTARATRRLCTTQVPSKHP